MTLQQHIKEAQERFTEQGAAIEHERWSRWMRYMIKRMRLRSDGTLEFDKDDFSRWTRQMITPYSELSEKEKESDRKETRNYLPLLAAELTKLWNEMIEDVERLAGDTLDVSTHKTWEALQVFYESLEKLKI